MRLTEKTVVITGAGSGIGAATAKRCGEEGAFVVVTDINGESAEQTATAITEGETEGTAISHELDVTDSEAVHDVVDAVAEEHGLDVLINNAGVGHPPSRIEDTDASFRDYVLDVNINGVWNGCHAALPHLKAQGSGAIVNVGSLASIRGLPKQAAYSLSKGAVLNFTRAVAAEAGPYGVRANTVCPGFTDTNLVEAMLAGYDDPEAARERLENQYPLKRFGKPKEVANAIVFLASDEASFVSGHGLVVDGGYATT